MSVIMINGKIAGGTAGNAESVVYDDSQTQIGVENMQEALEYAIENANIPIASATTLGGVKVGENLSIDENGILSSQAQAGVELTQAEYNALSEEEKMNGTVYYITDGSAAGGVDEEKVLELIKDNAENAIYEETTIAEAITNNTESISTLNQTYTSKMVEVDKSITDLTTSVGNKVNVSTYTSKMSSLDSSISSINANLGDTDISSIGDGTVTGAVAALSSAVSNVGNYLTTTQNVFVENSTSTEICSLTLSSGVWLLNGSFMGSLASTIFCCVSNNPTTYDYTAENCTLVHQTTVAKLSISKLRIVQLTEPETFYLSGYQSSGSTQYVTGFLEAVQIK